MISLQNSQGQTAIVQHTQKEHVEYHLQQKWRPQTLRFRHQVCASAVDLWIEVCHHLNIIISLQDYEQTEHEM